MMKSPYNGSLTREQFLFHEMRTTARLMCQGLSDKDITDAVIRDNLFQFPTERTIKQQVRCCLSRLHALNNDTLVHAIAEQPFDDSKQICLFAIMKQNRVVWDFMITVIGSKYQQPYCLPEAGYMYTGTRDPLSQSHLSRRNR